MNLHGLEFFLHDICQTGKLIVAFFVRKESNMFHFFPRNLQGPIKEETRYKASDVACSKLFYWHSENFTSQNPTKQPQIWVKEIKVNAESSYFDYEWVQSGSSQLLLAHLFRNYWAFEKKMMSLVVNSSYLMNSSDIFSLFGVGFTMNTLNNSP